MNKLKDNTINFIIKESISLFLKNSIQNVTMSDIAKNVGVGEATLYRYFKKKSNIVLNASITLLKEIFETYFVFDSHSNGYKELETFYSAFLKIFREHPDYYKFINELDAYILLEKDISTSEYEDKIAQFYKLFKTSYKKGRSDSSVKNIKDIETFYFSTTHSLLNLCKYLAGPAILSQDEKNQKEKEITVLINLILQSLKN